MLTHCHSFILHASTKSAKLGILQFTSKMPEIMSIKWDKIQKLKTLLKKLVSCDRSWCTRFVKLNMFSSRKPRRRQPKELERFFSGNGIYQIAWKCLHEPHSNRLVIGCRAKAFHQTQCNSIGAALGVLKTKLYPIFWKIVQRRTGRGSLESNS